LTTVGADITQWRGANRHSSTGPLPPLVVLPGVAASSRYVSKTDSPIFIIASHDPWIVAVSLHHCLPVKPECHPG
jgi:hypothetical protein